ncbi:DUF6968 family protein [Actinomadura rugatobispora]|uniref:DUF6968 family protein n=1 Tax=Actinomadura rugatobispora TaxID=1994 RepID=A0ABW0ZV43_9ACTN|nr:hypothetical protein GCM10010200_110070 [Actinomadura rugatobispora]
MTTTHELGEVVAERRVEAVAEDGRRTPVILKFGRPHPDPLSAHDDWCCPHQIVGLGDETVQAAFGVDSLQALLLSVYAVRLKLVERAAGASVSLEWEGGPDLGLTVVPEPHEAVPPATCRGF